MIVECSATDVVYTDVVSGIHGNYLRPSLAVAGIDPDNPRRLDVPVGYADHGRRPKAWRDIWSAGHGVGGIEGIESVGQCMERLQHEYDDARARLANGGLT